MGEVEKAKSMPEYKGKSFANPNIGLGETKDGDDISNSKLNLLLLINKGKPLRKRFRFMTVKVNRCRITWK